MADRQAVRDLDALDRHPHKTGVNQADEQDEEADANPDGALQVQRNGNHHRLPEARDHEQRDDQALDEDHTHRGLPRQSPTQDELESDDGVQTKAGCQGKRVVRVQTHGDRHDPGRQGRHRYRGREVRALTLRQRGENSGVHEQDVSHDDKRRQAAADLRPN